MNKLSHDALSLTYAHDRGGNLRHDTKTRHEPDTLLEGMGIALAGFAYKSGKTRSLLAKIGLCLGTPAGYPFIPVIPDFSKCILNINYKLLK